MTRHFSLDGERRTFRYSWGRRQQRYALEAQTIGEPKQLVAGSAEQFITEHYWGYAKQRDGGTVEYRVAHEPWRVWNVIAAKFEGNPAILYGAEFEEALTAKPHSAFVADGSAVQVFSGKKLER
jgi:hypothetical protein